MHDIQAVLKVLAVAVGCALLIACVKAATVLDEVSLSTGPLQPAGAERDETSSDDSLSELEKDRASDDVNNPEDQVPPSGEGQESEPEQDSGETSSSEQAAGPIAQNPEHSEITERKSEQHWPEIAGALSGRRVLGYYAEDYQGDTASLESLKKYGHLIDCAAAFSFQVDEKGQVNVQPVRAFETDIAVLALVHNFHNGWFDRHVAAELLRSPESRTAAVADIVAQALEKGYAGVHIDLENFGCDCRQEFTLFMQELKADCDKEGLGVSMAVPAKTYDDINNQWSGGFDYQALAQHVDFMVLMTYDQHWFGGTPGPIAAINWVEDVVRYAVSQVPREKLYLGIAGYGYDWASNGKTKALSMKAVEALAASRGGSMEWHSEFQVPYLLYQEDSGVRHQLWFENEVSLLYKLKLVEKYDLAGIALWRLGFANEEFWNVIERAR